MSIDQYITEIESFLKKHQHFPTYSKEKYENELRKFIFEFQCGYIQTSQEQKMKMNNLGIVYFEPTNKENEFVNLIINYAKENNCIPPKKIVINNYPIGSIFSEIKSKRHKISPQNLKKLYDHFPYEFLSIEEKKIYNIIEAMCYCKQNHKLPSPNYKTVNNTLLRNFIYRIKNNELEVPTNLKQELLKLIEQETENFIEQKCQKSKYINELIKYYQENKTLPSIDGKIETPLQKFLYDVYNKKIYIEIEYRKKLKENGIDIDHLFKEQKSSEYAVECLEKYYNERKEIPIFSNIKNLPPLEKYIYNFIIRYQRDPSFLSEELKERMKKLPIPVDRKIINRKRPTPRIYGSLKEQKIKELVYYFKKNNTVPTKNEEIYSFYNKIRLHHVTLAINEIKMLKDLLLYINDYHYFSAYKEFEREKELLEKQEKESKILKTFSLPTTKTEEICKLYQKKEPFNVKNFLIHSNLIIGLKNNMIYVTNEQRKSLTEAGMKLASEEIIKKNILENYNKLEEFSILKNILSNEKEEHKEKILKKN